MTERSAQAALRGVVATLGLGIVGLTAALVDRETGSSASYGGVSTLFAVLELVVGSALLAAALLLLGKSSTATVGALAVAAATAWLAPVWVGWEGGPSIIRSAGLAAAPLLPLVVLAVTVQVPPPATGAGRRLLVACVTVLATASIATTVALVLVRDPLRDLYCWSDCTVSPLLGVDDPLLTRRLTRAVLGLGAASGTLAALVGGVRLARLHPVARRASGLVLAAAAMAGLALAAYAVALVVAPRELPGRPLYGWLFAARALALLTLAGGVVWLGLRPRLVRGLVTRLAVDLERSAAEGGIGELLAGALSEPGLRLAYPVGSEGRIVDADGRALVFGPARQVTELVGEDGVVALVESEAASVGALERELGPAAQLALGNERLRAEALMRLADVTSSRARIVETADAARRRMERDLHDGAQQRLLALTYDLRVALTIAESSGDTSTAAPLRGALERAASAAQELRDIAHGIFPAELAASGVGAALAALADLRPLRLTVELPPGRRFRPDVEAAAYALVAEASEDDGALEIGLREVGRTLEVTVEGAVAWDERLVRLEDRVGAAGGRMTVSGRRLEATLPTTP
jgi:signal transduction histidine kinase